MVSGGVFLTEPIAPGAAVSQEQEGTSPEKVDNGNKVLGKVSERELGRRERTQWSGEDKFSGLSRRIWVLRCLDRLRRWNRAAHLIALVVGAEDEAGGTLSEEALPGNLPLPENWVLDEEAIREMVRFLAQAAAPLNGARACQEIVETTIVYIKWKVAQCNPRWAPLPDVAMADNDELARITQRLINTTVEKLLKDADLSAFDANGMEWRQFLLDVLFDDPTDADKDAAANAFLQEQPKPGTQPTAAQQINAAARTQAAALSGDELACGQIEPLIGPLIARVVWFNRDFGPERLAQAIAHFRRCPACKRSLGESLIKRRNRNALDARLREDRCGGILASILVDYLEEQNSI